MAIHSAQLDVDTDPVRLSPVPTDSVSGSAVIVKNTGSVTVYLGADDVDMAAGFPLDAGETISVDLNQGEVLFGVAESATTVARLAEGV